VIKGLKSWQVLILQFGQKRPGRPGRRCNQLLDDFKENRRLEFEESGNTRSNIMIVLLPENDGTDNGTKCSIRCSPLIQ
jgi:hypothetical protein